MDRSRGSCSNTPKGRLPIERAKFRCKNGLSFQHPVSIPPGVGAAGYGMQPHFGGPSKWQQIPACRYLKTKGLSSSRGRGSKMAALALNSAIIGTKPV
jgi:hypothetical protein